MRTLLCSLFLFAVAGCSPDTPTASTQPANTTTETAPTETTVVPEPVVSALAPDDSATDKIIVVDVRSKAEWDTGHVDQAIHIPHTEITERVSEITNDKDAKIVVHCAVGGRAEKAKTALETLGFTNVENGGGYDDVKERFEPK